MLWPAPLATRFLALRVLLLLRLLLTLLRVLRRLCRTLDVTLPSLDARVVFFRRGGRIGVFVFVVVASESENRLVVRTEPWSSVVLPSFCLLSLLLSESVFCFCFCFFIVSSRAWYKLAAMIMASSEVWHTNP